MGKNTSPLPQPKADPVLLSFPDAMKEVIDGKSVTRKEWNNNDYCFLEGPWLSISRNGKIHQWVVNDGDMTAYDWFVVESKEN
jgi:hypothetical protein